MSGVVPPGVAPGVSTGHPGNTSRPHRVPAGASYNHVSFTQHVSSLGAFPIYSHNSPQIHFVG